jgi:hypothetical protein
MTGDASSAILTGRFLIESTICFEVCSGGPSVTSFYTTGLGFGYSGFASTLPPSLTSSNLTLFSF